MKLEKIDSNNKLIAEFDKHEFYTKIDMSIKKSFTHTLPSDDIDFNDESNKMYYHDSWNWLIPVVEKIERLRKISEFNLFNVNISTNRSSIDAYYDAGVNDVTNEKELKATSWMSVDGHKKLLCTYKLVVEFIKWYNKNRKV